MQPLLFSTLMAPATPSSFSRHRPPAALRPVPRAPVLKIPDTVIYSAAGRSGLGSSPWRGFEMRSVAP
jgi:hypothetical protein